MAESNTELCQQETVLNRQRNTIYLATWFNHCMSRNILPFTMEPPQSTSKVGYYSSKVWEQNGFSSLRRPPIQIFKMPLSKPKPQETVINFRKNAKGLFSNGVPENKDKQKELTNSREALKLKYTCKRKLTNNKRLLDSWRMYRGPQLRMLPKSGFSSKQSSISAITNPYKKKTPPVMKYIKPRVVVKRKEQKRIAFPISVLHIGSPDLPQREIVVNNKVQPVRQQNYRLRDQTYDKIPVASNASTISAIESSIKFQKVQGVQLLQKSIRTRRAPLFAEDELYRKRIIQRKK